MDISIRETDRRVKFTSLNNPVKAFKIKTQNDVITFKEVNYKKPPKDKLLGKVAEFFIENFANQSSNPDWRFCKKGTKDFSYEIFNYFKDNILVNNYKKLLKNPDTTLIIGRNKKNRMSAVLLAEPLNLTSKIKDNNTLYIDSIAIQPELRGKHIGQTLINEVEQATQDRFKKSFLVAYKESVPFYKKQGYKHVINPRFILNLRKERDDYPRYVAFMEKKYPNL